MSTFCWFGLLLVFLFLTSDKHSIARLISANSSRFYTAFTSDYSARVEKARLNLSFLFVSAATFPDTADDFLPILSIQNISFLLNLQDPQILANIGEFVGNVLRNIDTIPKDVSRCCISVLVERINSVKESSDLEKCILGALLKVLCRVEVSLLFIQSQPFFSSLLSLASSPSSIKQMVPIILASLFTQFDDTLIIQDACLRCLSDWYKSGDINDTKRALFALAAIFQAKASVGSLILQTPGID